MTCKHYPPRAMYEPPPERCAGWLAGTRDLYTATLFVEKKTFVDNFEHRFNFLAINQSPGAKPSLNQRFYPQMLPHSSAPVAIENLLLTKVERK